MTYLVDVGDGGGERDEEDVGRREDDGLLPHRAAVRVIHVVELVEDHGEHLHARVWQ